MITPKNYEEKKNSLDWSSFSETINENRSDIEETMEYYDDSPEMAETIDLFLNYINKNSSKKDAPKKNAPVKERSVKPVVIKAEKNYDLIATDAGGVTVVSNKSEDGIDGDYAKIAHVTKNGEIKYFEEKLPKEVIDYVKKVSTVNIANERSNKITAGTSRKKNGKIATVVTKNYLDNYSTEFMLIRRFWNVIKSEDVVLEFRKAQLLYSAFNKAAVERKVRKTSEAADLFNKANDKMMFLFEKFMKPNQADVKVSFSDKELYDKIEAYVSNVAIHPMITVLKSFISIQNTFPEKKKAEALIKRLKKAVEAPGGGSHRLSVQVHHAIKILEEYVKNPKQSIEAYSYGLSKPRIPYPKFTPIKFEKKKKGLAVPMVSENISQEEPEELEEHRVVPSSSIGNSNLEKLKKLGFVSADNVPKEAANVFVLPNEIGTFLQKIQPHKALILIKGTKHTSKSQLAMQAANAFAENGMPVAYIDYEQGGLECKDTVDSVNRNTTEKGRKLIAIKGFLEKPFEELKSFCKYVKVIVADSVTDLGISADQLNELRVGFPEVIWCFISQVKENGEMYGGNKMAHNPTMIVNCHKSEDPRLRYATLEKNRGNDLSLIYSVYYKKIIESVEELHELAYPKEIKLNFTPKFY